VTVAVKREPALRCDFEGTLALLGERHVLMLLYLLYQESPRRFNELKTEATVNTATLSDRLKRLERLGIVKRTVIRSLPRRVEYGITPMGRDLLKMFRAMLEWRSKYSHHARATRTRRVPA